MKFVEQSCEEIVQQPGILGMYKQIELAGRTCYKSEDKITEDSAKSFVKRMIDSDHTAMLEHGTVYLYLKHDVKDGVDLGDPWDISFDITLCKYGEHKSNFDTHETFFTTNLRWLVEKYPEDWEKILACYWSEPDERWPKRRTVKCTTNIQVYKDLTRHSTMSFAIESTRFCNYSKGKFGSELTFIKPCWCKYISVGKAYWHDGICFRTGATEENMHMGDRSWNGPKEGDDEKEWRAEEEFLEVLWDSEKSYMKMIECGWQPQQAANILQQATKADMVMTGSETDWKHVFDIRYYEKTGNVHPQVKELVTKIYNQLNK